MLYVSTRNNTDVYTAYRALHESNAPDGGYYFPFRLPHLSPDELYAIRNQSPGETIAYILNLFFGLRLTGWDVECVIGRFPFQIISMNYRLLMAEVWRNPEGSWDYLLRSLYGLLLGKKGNSTMPAGWVLIAIEIALFFGVYSADDIFPKGGLDVAVTAGDFSDVISVLFAKDMGFPANVTICVFNENGAVWDFINKGELSTGVTAVRTSMPELDHAVPNYLEYLLFRCFGSSEVIRYTDACERKANYYIDDEYQRQLNHDLFAAVVSTNRVELIKSGMYRTNQYNVDPYTALVYGGLQDYRAHTGISKDTLILAKKRIVLTKE